MRTLSRRGAAVDARAEAMRGNVISGEGVAAAVDGLDAVVHAATNAQWRARLLRLRGWVLRDLDNGLHLCPDHKAGRVTWEDWPRKPR